MLKNQTWNDKVACQKGNSPEQVYKIKKKNKVPKLLLSEIKVVFSLIRPGNRLRSGHFLKTS
jgi:hypothetical protein